MRRRGTAPAKLLSSCFVCAFLCWGTYAHLDCRKRAAINATDEVG